MSAGAYRDRVLFQRRHAAADAYGNVTDGEWDDLFSVWGDFEDATGKERRDGGAIESEVMATLVVRKTGQTGGVGPADRVEISGEAYNIRAIRRPTRTGQIHFDLERGVAP